MWEFLYGTDCFQYLPLSSLLQLLRQLQLNHQSSFSRLAYAYFDLGLLISRYNSVYTIMDALWSNETKSKVFSRKAKIVQRSSRSYQFDKFKHRQAQLYSQIKSVHKQQYRSISTRVRLLCLIQARSTSSFEHRRKAFLNWLEISFL